MATFIVRPRKDGFGNENHKSDPTKDFWEHLFESGDELFLRNTNPAFPNTNVAVTELRVSADVIGRTDIPSVSGSANIKTLYARVKGEDVNPEDPQTWRVHLGGYDHNFNALDGWITKSQEFNIDPDLIQVLTMQIAVIVEVIDNGDGYSFIDYLYLEIDYTPALPDVYYQDIKALDEGNLAVIKGYFDSLKYTRITSSGLQIRLKSTGEIIKTIDYTGDNLIDYVEIELGDDVLKYGTNYEGRTYAGVEVEGIGYGEWIEFTTRPAPVEMINIKAEKIAGSLTLYGEIIVEGSSNIIERGFEYKIQDEEPELEDIGTEVKETGYFEAGEYYLSSWGTYNDLYRAEENKIWWFRAYCKDEADNKYIAETWMKNVPTMITYPFLPEEVFAQSAKANGEMTDKGANIVTKRGFRIIKEYEGDLFGANDYRYDGFQGEVDMQMTYDKQGKLIGFMWIGELYRDSLYEDEGGYELGIYDKILGGGFLGEGFGLYLKPNDTYKIVAVGENQLGKGFGEEVELITGQMILPSEDENVSPIAAEKTITLGTIPEGTVVTRIGIRLGRTMGCNEKHVYEDGEWLSGGSVTFYITDFVPGNMYYKMPYIILNYGDYEEEIKAIPDFRNPERLEEWLEDYPVEVFPDVPEEEEEKLDKVIIDASVGDICYKTIIREIKCEKIGEQSFIDRFGRRRSQTITNHLIQSRNTCKLVIDDYIDKFQILKLKVLIDYDIPIPFEREDIILLGDGKYKFKENGEGLLKFKETGKGEILEASFILAKIRKIDGNYISGSELILGLELEV